MLYVDTLKHIVKNIDLVWSSMIILYCLGQGVIALYGALSATSHTVILHLSISLFC